MTSRSPSRMRLPGFGIQVLPGMILGLSAGLIVRNLDSESVAATAAASVLQTGARIFVQLLRALVPPLVFTAIVTSIAAIRELENAVRLVLHTLAWFAITALIAVVIGIALGVTLHPGLHAGVAAASAQRPASVGGWLDFLTGLIPENYLGSGLVDHSQKRTVAARARAEPNAVGQRS